MWAVLTGEFNYVFDFFRSLFPSHSRLHILRDILAAICYCVLLIGGYFLVAFV